MLQNSKALRFRAEQQDEERVQRPDQQAQAADPEASADAPTASADATMLANVDPALVGDFAGMSIAELLQLDLILIEGGEAEEAESSETASDDPIDLTELSLLELMDVRAVAVELPELPDLNPPDVNLLLPNDSLDLGPPSHLFPAGGLTPVGVLAGTESMPPPPPPPPPPDPGVNVAPDARNDSYSVLEDALLVRSSVSGVLLNDVDANFDALQVSLVSGPANGKLTLTSKGAFTYDSNQDFNGKDSFTYMVTDGRGGADIATAFITVVSVNDAPTIVAGGTTATGSAAEIADGAPDENSFTHQATGTVAFADVDLPNTHSASVVPQGSGYLGSLVLGTVDQVGDTVDWTFSVNDSILDGLSAGEIRTQSYNIVINDKSGGTATQAVTITLTGENDAPTIVAGTTATGTVTEVADKAGGENTVTHSETGTIFFDDVDLKDSHSASTTPQSTGYLGNFVLGALNQTLDRVGWTFTVGDGELDGLAAGEVVTQSYDVAIDDGNGGTVTQAVTITLNGVNDAPTIVGGATSAAGSVTEEADGSAGENGTTHQAAGTIAFADVDVIDVHGATVTPVGLGYLGSLALGTVDQSGKTVDWTFTVDDTDLESLPDGAALTQTYTVTISDGNGGTTTQTITITINGVNDAPAAAAFSSGGDVDENSADGTVVAVVVADDPDVGDVVTYSLSDDAGGRFAINPTTGAVTVADGSLLDFETNGSHSITVVASDGSLTSSTVLTITVNDVNEAPTGITLSNVTVDENADGAVIGTLTVADPDAGDSHSFTVSDNRFEVVGGKLQLVAGTSLDFETESSVSVDVTATDKGGLDHVETFVISVGNVQEPLFSSGDDTVDFNTVVDGDYTGGTQYDALNGNDSIVLPADAAAALAAGYDALTTFSAGEGDDTVTGGGLADLIAGGMGADSLAGGDGNDVFEWDSGDAAVDGGNGTDTLFSDVGDVDLSAAAVTVANIEQIDLAAGVGANTLTLSAADVLAITDSSHTLRILGDSQDSVEAGTGWSGGLPDVNGDIVYTKVVGAGTATLVVDADVAVNADILNP